MRWKTESWEILGRAAGSVACLWDAVREAAPAYIKHSEAMKGSHIAGVT